MFPTIYDTKYICNSSPVIFNKLNLNSSLGNCYEFLRNKEKQSMA
ncbi:hypothetical protein E6Q11_01460 [Candidatus Dojkabacteria bacterium]|uniref:Uncharacterized protein n=1 Tax=Candidatus Dojkabacteria bacterium TaxID=2099670 RepID=A0A5C7J9N7_9BACT|nr:MAG: hypothetical protein E6Q11_01460 [Candidatus Dojkabacteria bacterium]